MDRAFLGLMIRIALQVGLLLVTVVTQFVRRSRVVPVAINNHSSISVSLALAASKCA
jgi:hypothetical protein